MEQSRWGMNSQTMLDPLYFVVGFYTTMVIQRPGVGGHVRTMGCSSFWPILFYFFVLWGKRWMKQEVQSIEQKFGNFVCAAVNLFQHAFRALTLSPTSCPPSRIHSLAVCFFASTNTLNIVHTEEGMRKSVDLLVFCSLSSNAILVLLIKYKS